MSAVAARNVRLLLGTGSLMQNATNAHNIYPRSIRTNPKHSKVR